MSEFLRTRCGIKILIDSEDKPFLSRFKWSVNKKNGKPSYARTCIFLRGKWINIGMHNLILGMRSQIVDHKNKNVLDNRKENLRLCSESENRANSERPRGKCYYRGVTKSNNSNKPFVAQINHRKRKHHIGTYKTAEEAAREYDKKAKELHGDFATLNFWSENV